MGVAAQIDAEDVACERGHFGEEWTKATTVNKATRWI